MDVKFAPHPSRHKPVLTYALLAVCFLFTMAAMLAGPDKLRDFTLSYSTGMQPIQWLLSPFIHLDMIQFFGSAIFIAAFGLMIEGRVGLAPFLVFFLVISVSSSAVEQVVMQGSGKTTKVEQPEMEIDLTSDVPLTAEQKQYLADRAKQAYGDKNSSKIKISKGASATIFGLIAIFLVIGPGSRMKLANDAPEIPLIALAVLFVVWEVGKWFLSGFSPGGPPVHLIGAVPGLAIGGLILTTGLGSKGGSASGNSDQQNPDGAPVETKKPLTAKERKEAASRIRNDRKEAEREKELLLRQSEHIKRPAKQRAAATDPIIQQAQQALKDERHAHAFKLLEEITEPTALAGMSVEDYNSIYKAFSKQKKWRTAASVLEKSLSAHPDDDSSRRLQLGRIMLAFKDRERCQKVLAKVKRNELQADQKTLYRQLVVQLRQLED